MLAAGNSVRLGSKISKPLVQLGAKPVLYYSLKTLCGIASIRSVVVVVNRANSEAIKRIVFRYGFSKVKAVVEGGARRQDSVARGLDAVGPMCDHVLIHDSARPFADSPAVNRLIKSIAKFDAAVLAVPVKSTIKQSKAAAGASPVVKTTLDREKLWEIQTPQVFKKYILQKAYGLYGSAAVTDDASLVEKLRIPVALVTGSYSNIKITTPEDLILAQALLKKRR
ncbi:MAG: 2-C-methyl-D-erythritol 4-phosphate cytidylyltransferase [Candidatus Omnitrophica bacterium]|nr:2-C-methyl-D-erythritol 4-phosphate cytidylyltransferase [Candidatus Omnitrophota bacterium]